MRTTHIVRCFLHRLPLVAALIVLHFSSQSQPYNVTTAAELAAVTGSDTYVIKNDIDVTTGFSTIASFSGTLEADIDPATNMPYRIKHLGVPLFTSLTGTVRNLVIDSVNISQSGQVGAIACTASGSARIYNIGILSGSVGSTSGNCGSIVGLLDGSARVINCYSFANITSGSIKAGIVGKNNVATVYTNIQTMVMNCMFYGDITEGGTIAPIYGGTAISNDYDASKRPNNRLNNYNYYLYEAPFSKNNTTSHVVITKYNCALAAEKRFLVRFEFYRHLLNSTRELAAWYATDSPTQSSMLKWVLDRNIAPYPILKEQGKYPSVVNYDTTYTYIDGGKQKRDTITVRNHGGRLGTLTVNISKPATPTAGQAWPSNVTIQSSVTIPILDKDTANYNFNYRKIQLPYYNDVGDKNYTSNKVVTGWMITGITGGTQGSYTETNYDSPHYNYADRSSYEKDLYSVSHRVFSQGGYFNVPDGVTAITIEPYWGKAAYLSDACYDRYGYNTTDDLTQVGGGQRYTGGTSTITVDGSSQTVYTTAATALATLTGVSSPTVYDYAVVLVGNYHHHATLGRNGPEISKDSKPFTIMSIDLNEDNEPDYCLIYRSGKNQEMAPIRFDFITVPGMVMAHKMASDGDLGIPGNCKPKGWFEITTTGLIKYGQFEHSYNGKALAPVIFMGGVIDQFVANNTAGADGNQPSYNNKTKYMLFGDNVWFKMLSNGTHMDNISPTPHRPISITGGEFESLYLSGYFRPDATACTAGSGDNNAECYIDGGRFGEVAGAGQEDISGNITWLIDHADMESFYGGGLKVVSSGSQVTGNISTTIKNSHVALFCGGPKFGDMAAEKTVTTTATDCVFGTYFGAGYGGTSIYRECPAAYNKYQDKNYDFNSWISGSYDKSSGNGYRGKYTSGKGVACGYEYELFGGSGGNVGRLYFKYASFSLAQTNDVTSTLTGCTVTENFYGGGSLGKVNGDATSILNNCTVKGSVFGAGFSATIPSASIMATGGYTLNGSPTNPNYNNTTGVYEKADPPATTDYKWIHEDAALSTGTQTLTDAGYTIKTNADLTGLGKVLGNVNLTITGSSHIYGDVYGGGAISDANTNANNTTTVNILDGTFDGNIYGGGQGDLASLGVGHSDVAAKVNGEVIVNIGKIEGGLGGNATFGSESSVFGCNNINGSPQADVTVNIYQTARTATEEASYTLVDATYAIPNVFGGGNKADYLPEDASPSSTKKATVHIHNCLNTVENVYGGGNAAAATGVATIIEGGRFNHIFGGGNGFSATGNHSDPSAANYNPGADIGAGGISLTVHGGTINQLFGGSNQYGDIDGPTVVSIDNEGGCTENITEFFGGGNEAVIGTELAPVDISTTISCGTGRIGTIYGGSNKADIHGDVELNIMGGGPYNYVYGGSKGVAGVTEAKIYGDVTLNIYGGAITKAFGGADAYGNIYGNIQVNVDWNQSSCADPKSIGYVYGGGNLAPYQPTVTNPVSLTPEVNIIHGTVTNNVFGGGLGAAAIVTANPIVTIGDITHETYVASVGGNVYGGGEEAEVDGSTSVVVQQSNTVVTGSVYGGGKGLNNNYLAAPVTGGTSVEMTGGWVKEDIYGGGEMASVGTYTRDAGDGHVTAVTSGGETSVSVIAGQVGHSASTGHVFGGGYGKLDDPAYAYVASTEVEIGGTAHVYRHVYGGGNLASVDGSTTVTIGNSAGTATPTVDANVFGGSALGAIGNATGTTTVNILAGTVSGDVFGGGNGDAETASSSDNRAADVRNEVVVNIGNATQGAGSGNNVVITGSVFGANNIMGSPKKNTLVNIYCTGHSDADTFPSGIASLVDDGGLTDADIEANKVFQTYALSAVYGGGNRAAHVPTSSSDSARVHVYYCDKNTIENIYGGGNAANTQNNSVIIYGGRIKNVFGGGNGDGVGNPGANVLGTATTVIHGGIIEYVFGGSNKLGNIGTTDLQTDGESECPIYLIENVFGGGNESVGGGGTITLKCGSKFHNFYGGANKANIGSLAEWNAVPRIKHNVILNVEGGVYDNVFGGNNVGGVIYGDVTVNVYGGNIGSLFGGNNLGGSIMGTITVNVNLDDDYSCPDGLNITNVYGGGNMALYEPANASAASPVVNIIHTTNNDGSKDFGINDVYGGGLGNGTDSYGTINYDHLTGYVHANPVVRIGSTTGTKSIIYGSIYGGGSAAPVTGNTKVWIDSKAHGATHVEGNVFGGGLGTTATVTGNTFVDVRGHTVIDKNVYGGGNAGTVTGSTKVEIGNIQH